MPTFTEVLEPTATSKNRAVTWTPAAPGVGVLTVTDTKSHVRYGVCEMPVGAGFSGRAVKLSKADGEVYCVRVGERAGDHHCDCKGFAFGRGKPCKHLAALAALLENGWLDERETVTDKHADAEGRDAWYARASDPTPEAAAGMTPHTYRLEEGDTRKTRVLTVCDGAGRVERKVIAASEMFKLTVALDRDGYTRGWAAGTVFSTYEGT